MASREENLKKINDELEIMSDEKLEQVAGGTWNEVQEDIKRFKALNIHINEGKALSHIISQDILTGSLIVAFRKHGVKYVRNWSNPNEYYINDKQVSQDEAWKHIEAQHKK